MILDEQKGCCYVRADLAEPVILASMREVFSFGSGTWCDGPDAKAVLEEGSGKFLRCNSSFKTLIILERKRLPEHLQCLGDSIIEKPTPLRNLLVSLEDAGEVLP